jgi:Tfp pilus assembly protein PilZ
VGDPKAIAITFSSGKDVLNAYWGFLSNGGLVIDDGRDLHEGDPVALEVTIESQKKRYQLRGQVVRRPGWESDRSDRVVIEFHPGEPHDLLLSAAWAETDNVPARRHRRYPVDRTVRYSAADRSDATARLLNISMGGCCMTLGDDNVSGVNPRHPLAAGARVTLAWDGLEATGQIRWSRAADVGVEFEPGAGVEQFVRRFL